MSFPFFSAATLVLFSKCNHPMKKNYPCYSKRLIFKRFTCLFVTSCRKHVSTLTCVVWVAHVALFIFHGWSPTSWFAARTFYFCFLTYLKKKKRQIPTCQFQHCCRGRRAADWMWSHPGGLEQRLWRSEPCLRARTAFLQVYIINASAELSALCRDNREGITPRLAAWRRSKELHKGGKQPWLLPGWCTMLSLPCVSKLSRVLVRTHRWWAGRRRLWWNIDYVPGQPCFE